MSDESVQRLKNIILTRIEETLTVPGADDLTIDEFFPDPFMAENTSHESFAAFLEASPCEYSPADSISEILGPELDDFVRETTEFGSWQEMQQTAEVNWMNEHLA
jgi:hypothetical protein